MANQKTRIKNLVAKKFIDMDITAITGSVTLGASDIVDLNGEADALVLDADGNTSISAPTDDQIDFEIAGADDFRMTANTFAALTGSTITGVHRHSVQELTASGAITLGSGLILLNHATVVIAATKAAPTAGDELYIIDNSASGTAAHTVTITGCTFHGGSNNTATLNAPGEALHLIAISATVWFILENIGSVALSQV